MLKNLGLIPVTGVTATNTSTDSGMVDRILNSSSVKQYAQELYAGLPVIDPALTDVTKGNSVTQTKGGKIVMRPSSLDSACPWQYAQAAILRKFSKPSGASQIGTTYHYAMELGATSMMQGVAPNANDLKEIGVMNWRKALDTMELHLAPKDSFAKMELDLLQGVDSYTPTFPRFNIIGAEMRFEAGLVKPSSVYSVLSGSMDRLDIVNSPYGKVVQIVDYKFTSKKSTTPKYAMQAGTYKLGVDATIVPQLQAQGIDVVSGGTTTALHNAVRGKQLKGSYKNVEQHIVHPDWDNAVHMAIHQRQNSLIDMGEMWHFLVNEMGVDPADAVTIVYPTTSPNQSYLCNELWCGYWHECPRNSMEAIPSVDLVSMLRGVKEKQHFGGVV